jgi:hypothetical protein
MLWVFNATFNNNSCQSSSVIGGGNQSTRRNPSNYLNFLPTLIVTSSQSNNSLTGTLHQRLICLV